MRVYVGFVQLPVPGSLSTEQGQDSSYPHGCWRPGKPRAAIIWSWTGSDERSRKVMVITPKMTGTRRETRLMTYTIIFTVSTPPERPCAVVARGGAPYLCPPPRLPSEVGPMTTPFRNPH